jgi:hypothetical protein
VRHEQESISFQCVLVLDHAGLGDAETEQGCSGRADSADDNRPLHRFEHHGRKMSEPTTAPTTGIVMKIPPKNRPHRPPQFAPFWP